MKRSSPKRECRLPSLPRQPRRHATETGNAVYLHLRFHSREKKNVADRCGVGEKHYKSVYTEAKTTCGRHTVLKCGDVVVVNLCIAVGLFLALCLNLTLEALLLVDGVVKLGECVTKLGAINEILESLGKEGILGLSLCEGAVLYGIIVDDSRLNKVLLNVSVKEL